MLCSFAELPSELLATPSLLGNSIIATTIYADFLFPYMTATRQTGREAAGTTPLVLAADPGFRVIEAKQKGSERLSSHCIADREEAEEEDDEEEGTLAALNSDRTSTRRGGRRFNVEGSGTRTRPSATFYKLRDLRET